MSLPPLEERPLVSIGLPTYRADPAYLRAALDSALAQTWRPIEVVITDDGGSEGPLAEAAARGAPEVRILRNEERRGLAGNWNRSLEAGTGPLCAVLHQDDVMEPAFLERAVLALRAHPSAGFVHTGWTAIDAAGAPMPESRAGPRRHGRDLFARGPEYLREAMAPVVPICCPAAVFRRDALLDAGPFDPSYRFAADLDMWFRLLLRHDVVHLAAPLFRYRLHEASTTTASGRARRYEETLQAKERGLARAAASGAVPAEVLAEVRRSVAREACACARRIAREDRGAALRLLGVARRVRAAALLSADAAAALLRAATPSSGPSAPSS